MKRVPKTLAMFVYAMLMACLAPCLALAEETDIAAGSATLEAQDAAIASGVTGTRTWVIDSGGKLTISPSDGNEGEMGNWSQLSDVPWDSYDTEIVAVKIEEGVKGEIRFGAFYGCTSLAPRRHHQVGDYDRQERLLLLLVPHLRRHPQVGDHDRQLRLQGLHVPRLRGHPLIGHRHHVTFVASDMLTRCRRYSRVSEERCFATEHDATSMHRL